MCPIIGKIPVPASGAAARPSPPLDFSYKQTFLEQSEVHRQTEQRLPKYSLPQLGSLPTIHTPHHSGSFVTVNPNLLPHHLQGPPFTQVPRVRAGLTSPLADK